VTHDPLDRERAQALMMAALDGEITPDGQRELDALLATFPELGAEWRRLVRVKEVTDAMTLHDVPQEVWDRYWTSVYRRTECGLAWILISAGAIVLAAYWLRFAFVAVALGAVILLVSVVRERLFMHRRDPYKEIVR
jgi:anti-sigma factor RsiW